MRKLAVSLLFLLLSLRAQGQITNVTVGAPGGGQGDGLFTAFTKLNFNDNWLKTNLTTLSNLVASGGASSTNLTTVSNNVNTVAANLDIVSNNVNTVVGNLDTVSNTVNAKGDVSAAFSFGINNRIIRSDGTAKGVKVSGATIDDSGNYLSSGTISISGNASVADAPYDAASWDGSNQVPTKNAVRDKIESLPTTQSPWATDINGNQKNLTNINSVSVGAVRTNGNLSIWGSNEGSGFTITNNADGNYRISLPASGLAGLVEFLFVGTNITMVARTNVLVIAPGDETTAITTGTAKMTFRAPHSMTIVGVRASLTTASSSGIPTFDINEAGTSILSTKLTIDASELTSTTAATAAVISDTSIADDAQITIDFTVAGTGAKGPKIEIYYTRP